MQRYNFEDNIFPHFVDIHNYIREGKVKLLRENEEFILNNLNSPVAAASNLTVLNLIQFYIRQDVYKGNQEGVEQAHDLLLLMISISNRDISNYQSKYKKIIRKICIELILHGIDLASSEIPKGIKEMKDKDLQLIIHCLRSIDKEFWEEIDLDYIEDIIKLYESFEDHESMGRWNDFYYLTKDKQECIDLNESKPYELVYKKLIKAHNLKVNINNVDDQPGLEQLIFQEQMDLGLQAIAASVTDHTNDRKIEGYFRFAWEFYHAHKIDISKADQYFLTWINKFTCGNYSILSVHNVYDLSLAAKEGSIYAIGFLKKLSHNCFKQNQESNVLALSLLNLFEEASNEKPATNSIQHVEALKLMYGLGGEEIDIKKAGNIIKNYFEGEDISEVTTTIMFRLIYMNFEAELHTVDELNNVNKLIEFNKIINFHSKKYFEQSDLLVEAAKLTNVLEHKISLVKAFIENYPFIHLKDISNLLYKINSTNLIYLSEIVNILISIIDHDCATNPTDTKYIFYIFELHKILSSFDACSESIEYNTTKVSLQKLLTAIEEERAYLQSYNATNHENVESKIAIEKILLEEQGEDSTSSLNEEIKSENRPEGVTEADSKRAIEQILLEEYGEGSTSSEIEETKGENSRAEGVPEEVEASPEGVTRGELPNDIQTRFSAFTPSAPPIGAIPSAPPEETAPSAPPEDISSLSSSFIPCAYEFTEKESKVDAEPINNSGLYPLIMNSFDHMPEYSNLYDALLSNDKKRVKKHLNIIRKTNRLDDINSIVETTTHRYSFTILHSILSLPGGVDLIAENSDLCNAINPQGLNYHGTVKFCDDSIVPKLTQQQGSSALECLTASEEGIKLLSSNAKLRSQITPNGLNKVVINKYTLGKSPLYLLTDSIPGLRILETDASLRAKITSEGLNADVAINNEEGAKAGESALYNLVVTSDLAILEKDATLRSKISSYGLNVQRGTEKIKQVTSVLYELAYRPKGMSLLLADSELVTRITAEGLNAIKPCGLMTGTSVLYLLSMSKAGRQILCKTDLLSKANKESINSRKYFKENQESTALCFLALYKSTREIILTQYDFRQKITIEGLNAVIGNGSYQGLSSLMAFSMYKTGRTLLAVSLKTMILKEALNAIDNSTIQSSQASGRSAASYLVTSEHGNRMFTSHSPDLFAMLNEDAFQSIIPEHPEIQAPLTLNEWLREPEEVGGTHDEIKARYVLSKLKTSLMNTQWSFWGKYPEAVSLQIHKIARAENRSAAIELEQKANEERAEAILPVYTLALITVASIGRKAAANLSLFAPANVKTYFEQYSHTTNYYSLR